MSFVQKYWQTLRKYPLPIWAGLSVIGGLQLNRVWQRAKEEHDLDGLIVTGYKALPLNAFSRWWGRANEVELPWWVRPLVLGTYSRMFKCNLEEAIECDISKYKSLGEFFRRRLKPGLRPIDENGLLVCPCDGRVLHFGQVDIDGSLESVKGVRYPVQNFLGAVPKIKDGNVLYYCTFYLAPGDYHGFHAPANFEVQQRHHFEGHLLSVSPSVVRRVPKLFHINERVIYMGNWEKGFFSFAAIGATNVGAIKIPLDSTLNTNKRGKAYAVKGKPIEAKFKDFILGKGEYIGEFNLGSSIVVIFEAPDNQIEFIVNSGDIVKMGQSIAVVKL